MPGGGISAGKTFTKAPINKAFESNKPVKVLR